MSRSFIRSKSHLRWNESVVIFYEIRISSMFLDIVRDKVISALVYLECLIFITDVFDI